MAAVHAVAAAWALAICAGVGALASVRAWAWVARACRSAKVAMGRAAWGVGAAVLAVAVGLAGALDRALAK